MSGVSQGNKSTGVRTTDPNADGRDSPGGDQSSPGDIDWSGSVTQADIDAAMNHIDHWHRNALHGTLVQRTSYCDTCPPETINSKGASQISWSPSQRYIANTHFVDASPYSPSCKVSIVPSDPKDGNALKQLTFAPIQYHDYDPIFSPLGSLFVFDRGDSVIIRKGLPWTPDTTEATVTTSNNPGCGALRGDDIPSVSPDGQWVAFSRCNGTPTGVWSLWKVPITGGAATQLTEAASRTDFYSSWSPDGQTIYFQRLDHALGPQYAIYKVPAAGGFATAVLIPPVVPPDTSEAYQPAPSPDGKILVMAYGKRDEFVPRVVTNTFDPTLFSPTAQKLIANYPDTAFALKSANSNDHFPILSPRLSPDGTRLALGSKQVWAGRRNMSLPPRITQVGAQTVADTTAMISLNAVQGAPTTVQVLATDPESDPIKCTAFFLQDGMVFDSTTCTLSWTPSAPVGTKFHVKFRVATITWPKASGGTDAIIAQFTVVSSLGPGLAQRAEDVVIADGPNPTREAFAITTPLVRGSSATLSVIDVSGRRVALIRGPSGSRLVWRGKDDAGAKVPAGIYLYRVQVGRQRQDGKVVLVR